MRAATLLLAIGALQQAPSLETTLSAVFSYVVTYETRLGDFIADEAMEQNRLDSSAVGVGRGISWRRWKSEVAFTRLPGGGSWLGYRNVLVVDGTPVGNNDRLQNLLARGPDEKKRAVDLAYASARFNLGMARTTNMPTLPLEFLHPRHRNRLTYQLHGIERVNGRLLRRLSFEEQVRPTLIRDPDGADVWSWGSVWIEESTSRIFEAEVRSDESSLRVSFAAQPGLDILVPVRMRETFPFHTGRGTGNARYSDFRRFATAARIVPQP